MTGGDESRDQQLREHLAYLMTGGGAHLDFNAAIEGLLTELRGARPAGSTHSPWRLLEHMRICQWDILEYSRNAGHISPKFPDGYRPEDDAPPTGAAWDESAHRFRSELLEMQDLVMSPTTDLFAQIPHGKPGHTILREALLVADHNAYHLGQLVMVRRALGAWSDG